MPKGYRTYREEKYQDQPGKIKHGYCVGGNKHPYYNTWKKMKSRCYYRGAKDYATYGGRGITVCERWMKSFTDWLADMGEKPQDGQRYTLHRINKHGNYEPGNCKWATNAEQAADRTPRKKAQAVPA